MYWEKSGKRDYVVKLTGWFVPLDIRGRRTRTHGRELNVRWGHLLKKMVRFRQQTKKFEHLTTCARFEGGHEYSWVPKI